MLTAYGYSTSGNCWKVKTILDLTGRAYEWVETDSNAGETRTQKFLALNPNGKIPIVKLDNGEVITESNAILLHFAEGTRFLPPPGLARTRVAEWLFFEQYSHEPYIAVARNWIALQKSRDKHAAELPNIWERGHKALKVMETRLAAHKYLAGDSLSIADIALYAYTHRAGEGDFDLTPYPGLRAWLARVAAEPGIVSMEPARTAVS
jgi:glutathione S-transferase